MIVGLVNSCHAVALVEEDGKSLDLTVSIPTEGNSWVVDDTEKSKQIVKKGGIRNWSENETKIRTYFKTTKTGKLDVGIFVKATFGFSKIKVSCNGKTEIVQIESKTEGEIPIGIFEVKKAGYQWIEIQGVDKSGDFFPEISNILIGGEAAKEKVYFAREDFYWGRRGPSVHLNFQIPENSGDVLYFYNEITVPENNDVLGSYFMANGFGQGYFGMQVNSPTERRILFSVWSPFKTDNPGDIPEDQKIKMLKKGEGVHTGEFGNEGSGGQSYYKFLWKAGNTYKFLLKGKPTGNEETDFTAWFFAPEVNEWKLIASFRRPKTDTYLTRPHSFLENFHTETGNVTRKGLYSNQWIYTINSQWIELTKMKFTADATARKESRMDYSGGAENQVFFMKNCGFFNETTAIDSYFDRKASGIPPVINFEELP
ncbi:MAG: DUF3472 domain-containing protein [Bacteroidetes bacterium]|nr:DUF3472 domain-containing protein [Bacteroidota bacterium]